ncbi:RNA polymerase factor sigma-54 [Halobacillus litoralis]|uniref:RNA polymerase factor sigma-54 n=1 Tax=Halobacillus litoralis TaxID=45668 RepID=UPI001CFD3CC8|nr:RNA polymerase factor sigma-54 [Halobacillus litoralis]
MKLELTHKQTTGLIMTTEMRQSMNVLQYSSAELLEYIRKEVDENPILTYESHTPSSSFTHQEPYNDPIEYIAQGESDWRNDLVEQANWLNMNPLMKKALLFLIGNLNDEGYCTVTEIETAEHLGVNRTTVTQARQRLLTFEPIGVGCYGLKEFLLLQMKRNHPEKVWISKIIEHHLEDLAAHQWDDVAFQMEMDLEKVEEAMDFIQTLSPRPSIMKKVQTAEERMPDLILEKKSGGYLLSDPYSMVEQIQWDDQLLHMSREDGKAYEFLDHWYKRAQGLVQSIKQRKATLMNVAEVIINHQRDFLNGGSLKPLKLKNVAETLDIHESTVSRTVSNKLLKTPEGLYPLKSFFAKGFQVDKGGGVSAHEVKQSIKRLIHSESSSHPLSDQKIADLLKVQHAIKVSRRTVAKYRESLHIPSSTNRKARKEG